MMYSILMLILIRSAHALIGYDCGLKKLNVTTLSLRDVGECDIPANSVNVTRKYVQLLQINEFRDTTVIQCKLEIHRTIYYCGMHSHISVVANGENSYIYEISRSSCENLHRTGTFRIANSHIINGVKVNNTVTHGVLFAGSLTTEGKCNGEGYSDPYGTWSSVIVQGLVRITLTEYTARVVLEDNKINLRSGTVCSLSDTSCIDAEGGYTFWYPVPRDVCKFNQYGILFEGYVNKIIDLDVSNTQPIYSLTTQDVTFALTGRGKENVCGYVVTKTEHPKLVIFETVKGESFAERSKTSVSNLDIFAYVNSKFVYVEKHIRTQMKNLYTDVIVQRCNLERQTLKTSLSLATQAPDEFAFDLMKGPGYMAVVAGEVVHIVKCIPVEVKIEHGERCYAELQVQRNNQTLFLTPRTHILKSKGTVMPCNALLPSYYFVGESWYKILPRPIEAVASMTLQPNTQPTWTYVNPSDLATSGIYTDKDLDQLRERIMFPVERPSLLNDLAREIRGHPIADNEGTILKLLNADAVEKIIESTWQNVWYKFMTFGTASAGIIMIMMILHIFKTIIDVIIQGIALHAVYGWSIHLLGAIWSSLTHFLLYLGRSSNKEFTPKETMDVEMTEAVITKKDTRIAQPRKAQTTEEASSSKPYFSLEK